MRHSGLRRSVLSLTVLAGTVVLTGCEESRDHGAASSATGSVSPAAEDTPAGATTEAAGDDGGTPFPGDVSPDVAEPSSDALLTVGDIRIGRHDGFDRVVFELGGVGTPGWDVRYVDEATSQGSGDPVDVAGDAVLQVSVSGVGYPYDTGVEEYSGPNPLVAEGSSVVSAVAFDATFEGTTVAFVGASTETPFRVYALANPQRLVVELQHQS